MAVLAITKVLFKSGRGGGQVVSVLAFYSDDPSSNPAVNFCKIVIEKNENKQKRGRGWPIFFKKSCLEKAQYVHYALI